MVAPGLRGRNRHFTLHSFLRHLRLSHPNHFRWTLSAPCLHTRPVAEALARARRTEREEKRDERVSSFNLSARSNHPKTSTTAVATTDERPHFNDHPKTTQRSLNDDMPPRPTLALLPLLLALSPSPSHSLVAAPSPRISVPFSNAWRFHFGPDVASGDIPGPYAADPFTTNLSTSTCTGLYPSPTRVAYDDCRISCAYYPQCRIWQSNDTIRRCYHGGSDAVCTDTGAPAGFLGGQRALPAAPVRTDYGFGAESLDDSSWALVDAPHDGLLVTANPFNESASSYHGYVPRVPLWYRKTFVLPQSWKDGGLVVQLNFEGVFKWALVFINGVPVPPINGNAVEGSGYLPFVVRLDNISAVRYGAGEPNVVAVRADTLGGSGHWYEGGGLVRNVWLEALNPAHFVEHGVFVSSQVAAGANLRAVDVPVTAEIECSVASSASTARVVVSLYSIATGALVATNTSALVPLPSPPSSPSGAPPTSVVALTVTLDLSAPGSLWSVQTPTLFTAVVQLVLGDAANTLSDAVNATVGFRTVLFDANDGMTVNGEPNKFRGFSNHDSMTGVGVAMSPRLDLFRGNALRALGGNVFRCSHNPYQTHVYEILARLGVLVWNENRDFGLEYENQPFMRTMAKRGRNNPAIVLNSLGNEIELLANNVSAGQALKAQAVAVDPTRPITANSNAADGLWAVVDVQGHSHSNNATIEAFHAQYPDLPNVLGECCSCTSQRLPPNERVTTLCEPSQNSPGLLPYVSGSLGVWTLVDYIGEPGVWPDVSSSFGQLDLAGFPKAAAYWYTVAWGQGIPASSPDRPPIPVAPVVRVLDLLDQLAYDAKTNATTLHGVVSTGSAELFVNGVSHGKQASDPPGTTLVWDVVVAAADDAHAAPAAPAAACTYPVNVSDVQCEDLTNLPSATSAGACAAAACAQGGSVWQFFAPKGCWVGFGVSPASCIKPSPGWVGFGRSTQPRMDVKNATLVALDDSGRAVASHTVLAPSGPPASLTLTLDVPSASTGTGGALYLDGKDTAMVRASVVDANGVLVSWQAVNVTFAVVGGPGRVLGVGNGDPAAHQDQSGAVAVTFAGLARGLVQVSVDCTSDNRDLMAEVDVEGGRRTVIVPPGGACPAGPITLLATAPGLVGANITISVSGDPADHPFAVASATGPALTGYTYLAEFEG